MKNFIKGFTIIIILLLIITNPNLKELNNHICNKNSKNNLLDQQLCTLYSILNKSEYRRHNLGILSIYTPSHKSTKNEKYIGILTFIIEI